MTHNQLDLLTKRYGGSFYIFYPERFVANLEEFRNELKSHYPNTKIAYALKANYMPPLIKLLYANDHWTEVASRMEYDIARLYLQGGNIIFNGPCKTTEDIAVATSEGAMVNIDSISDIKSLSKFSYTRQEVHVGIRVNFDIGTGPSRFGFNYENSDFGRALDKLSHLANVRVIGIHSHFTTRERSLELFERRVKGMLQIYKSMHGRESVKYVNIGGGFFGPMSSAAKQRLSVAPPSFAEYAAVIGRLFSDHYGENGPTLIVEPGISVVADSMDFVVRILDKKSVADKTYLLVDGSINNLYPTGSKYLPDFSLIESGTHRGDKYDVVGYTCMEHDILLVDVEIRGGPGDFIVFHNRGAYSNVYKPPFIRAAPPIIGVNGEIYSRQQTYRDVISTFEVN